MALLAGAAGDARVRAGGTDLLVQMRADIVDPDLHTRGHRPPQDDLESAGRIVSAGCDVVPAKG